MSSIPRAALAVLVAAIMLSAAAPASAYDTGAHFELT
jgi:hypothetical protein